MFTSEQPQALRAQANINVLERKQAKVVPKYHARYGIKTLTFLLMQNRYDTTKRVKNI